MGRGEEGEAGGREVEMDSAAIEFCARKVSSVHGDLRKALDICRSVSPPTETVFYA